jgi:hypothetical protein
MIKPKLFLFVLSFLLCNFACKNDENINVNDDINNDETTILYKIEVNANDLRGRCNGITSFNQYSSCIQIIDITCDIPIEKITSAKENYWYKNVYTNYIKEVQIIDNITFIGNIVKANAPRLSCYSFDGIDCTTDNSNISNCIYFDPPNATHYYCDDSSSDGHITIDIYHTK